MELLLAEEGGSTTSEAAVAALGMGDDPSSLAVDPDQLEATAEDGTVYGLNVDPEGNWRVDEVLLTCAEVLGP